MLKWISKVLGGTNVEAPVPTPTPAPTQAPAAEAVPWLTGLEKLLAPIDAPPGGKVRAGLASDILGFVRSGEPLAILGELAQLPAVGKFLHLTEHHFGLGKGKWQELYEGFDEVPPAIMLRWCMILDACIARTPRAHALQLPNGVHWPEVLLLHASGTNITGWVNPRPVVKHLSALGVERLLIEAGLEPSALVVSAFATPVAVQYGTERRMQLVTDLDGYSDAVERHAEDIRPALLSPEVPQRLSMLGTLEKAGPAALAKLAPELADLAVSSSKQVRAAAEPLVRRCSTAILSPLKSLAVQAKPEQRLHALRLLGMLARTTADEALQTFARETALADKAPSVKALAQEWDVAQGTEAVEADRYEFAVPVIDWSNALTPQISSLLEDLWQEINQAIDKSNKQQRDHYDAAVAAGKPHRLHQHPRWEPDELTALRDYIRLPSPGKRPESKQERRTNWGHVLPAVQKLSTNAAMNPVAMVKVLAFFELLTHRSDTLAHGVASTMNAMHQVQGRPSLLELAEMLAGLGIPHSALFRNYCNQWSGFIAKDWNADAVWPFFAHNLELLLEQLNPAQHQGYWFDRSAVFRAVATLPIPPATVVNALFDLALGTGKSDRLPAQAALAQLPGKEVRIINALGDGKAEVRAVAAQWLGRLRHAPAIAALETAVAKEKHDIPKGAMLDALQLLGQPVEKYLDRKALAVEAAKSVAKGIGKDLEWFPFGGLPAVHWADSGQLVPVDVVRWMLVQAVKHKSAEPNAVLRKYCALFEPRDREALGQFVLEAWIAEDVRPIPADDAMKRAVSQAQSTHAFMAQHPQYFKDSPNLGRSVEELTALALPGLLRQPAGSAIASKGLMAVVAACAAERAAAPVARYLKEYYGTRAAHGKAFIAMLAWIEHPTATQLMLSIGSRFRTKSFQEEATRQAEALADRKGWTLAELADRTMPSAGFDETGTLELSYGSRVFTARLLPDFKIDLFNPDGKKIAALPDPRQDDDAVLAKDAKKAFSTAKKEIKNIVDLQTQRLYEALCTERDWPFDDWNRYLNQHPIVRRLAQRLVWSVVDDDKVLGTFRPLDDGTLTDREDNEVRPPNTARVRVAHDSNLPVDEVAQWQQHLIDYAIKPLFQQFGKGNYALPAGKSKATQIEDFEGHLLEAFALRGRSLKLGYTRGPAEDGGWFHVYEKRFPTLGLQAVLEFTGNPLPESNRTVALLNMSFSRSGGDAWQRPKMALSDVPKVLLSECYNDMRLIAGEGSGFDADWQKKSEY